MKTSRVLIPKFIPEPVRLCLDQTPNKMPTTPKRSDPFGPQPSLQVTYWVTWQPGRERQSGALEPSGPIFVLFVSFVVIRWRR